MLIIIFWRLKKICAMVLVYLILQTKMLNEFYPPGNVNTIAHTALALVLLLVGKSPKSVKRS